MTKGVLLCARACLSRGDQTVRAECGFETQSVRARSGPATGGHHAHHPVAVLSVFVEDLLLLCRLS